MESGLFCNSESKISLMDIIKYVSSESIDELAAKDAYDKFVRDIIKEDRVASRIFDRKNGSSGANKKSIKPCSITSREMIIYDNSDDLDEPRLKEPSGVILYSIRLSDTQTQLIKPTMTPNRRILRISSKVLEDKVVDLYFKKGDFDIFEWSKYV